MNESEEQVNRRSTDGARLPPGSEDDYYGPQQERNIPAAGTDGGDTKPPADALPQVLREGQAPRTESRANSVQIFA